MSKNNNGYFKKLLQGDIDLKITFWLWFILFTFTLNTFIDINFDELDIQRTQGEEFFTFLIYLFTVIYSMFIFIAVIRSANKFKGSRTYAFLAKLIVSINLFFSLTTLFDVLKVLFIEDYALQNEINEFKKNLPIPIDSYTSLIDINKEKKDINYTYKLTQLRNQRHIDYSRFKGQIKDSICENEDNLALLKKEYSLNYTYLDNSEKKLFDVTTKKEDCGKNIYDLEILREIIENE